MNPVQYLVPYPFNIHFIIYRPLTPKFYKWSSPTDLATNIFCLFLSLVCVIRPVHLVILWLDYAKNTVCRAEYNVRISCVCSFLQSSLLPHIYAHFLSPNIFSGALFLKIFNPRFLLTRQETFYTYTEQQVKLCNIWNSHDSDCALFILIGSYDRSSKII